MGADPVDLGEAVLARLFEERRERVLVEPGRRLGEGRDRGQLGRRVRGREVAEQAGLLEPRLAVLGDLHREEPLVDHLPEPVHDARPVEVDARRALVLERVEGRALAEHVERLRVGVPPDRLEERMAGRDPLQLLRLGRLAVGGAARIAVRESRELPVRVLLVAAEDRGRARRLEGVRHARDGLERERHELGRLAEEARDGLRHDAPLLRPRAPLDQHLEVELLAREPLQGVLADGAELPLVHVAEQALLEVGVAELPGVVVAQHALDVGRGQDLADDVEDGVVVQRVADLLELLEQPLQDAAFDGVGGHEVEDQAVLALAVAVDAAHPLLEAVRVPGDVVVEEDVADLKVDPLARGLGGDQDLDLAFAELLLGVEARARLVARARLHAAVDAADAEAPGLEAIHEVVQRVLELGEEEQALVRVVEEALLLEQRP